LKHYQRVIVLNPLHALAFSNIGMVYFGLFQRDNDRSFLKPALQNFNKSIQLDPSLSDAYNGRGAVYLVLNESNKAVLDFKKVIQLKPEFVDAYFNLTYALVNGGRKKEAADMLDRFKKSFFGKLDPKDQNELDRLIAEINS